MESQNLQQRKRDIASVPIKQFPSFVANLKGLAVTAKWVGDMVKYLTQYGTLFEEDLEFQTTLIMHALSSKPEVAGQNFAWFLAHKERLVKYCPALAPLFSTSAFQEGGAAAFVSRQRTTVLDASASPSARTYVPPKDLLRVQEDSYATKFSASVLDTSDTKTLIMGGHAVAMGKPTLKGKCSAIHAFMLVVEEVQGVPTEQERAQFRDGSFRIGVGQDVPASETISPFMYRCIQMLQLQSRYQEKIGASSNTALPSILEVFMMGLT